MTLLTEIVLAFVLVFVAFEPTFDRRAPEVGALYVGFTVSWGALKDDAMSRAAINSIRYIGPALLSGELQYAWLPWTDPLPGGGWAGNLNHYVLEVPEP